MRIGQMRHRIDIQSHSTSRGSFGQTTDTGWTTTYSAWSSIKAATAKDAYAVGAGFTSQVTHKITMRYQPSFLPDTSMRANYRGRIFIILAVSDPDEMRKELDLLCQEQSK